LPELYIIIAPDGSVTVEADGYTGSKCLEASRPYEKDLGVPLERRKKPEMFSGEGVKAGDRSRVGH